MCHIYLDTMYCAYISLSSITDWIDWRDANTRASQNDTIAKKKHIISLIFMNILPELTYSHRHAPKTHKSNLNH